LRTAYNSSLDYLYSSVDYGLKHSSELVESDFSPDRLRTLMGELGNPPDQYRIVHVAGTKGKGVEFVNPVVARTLKLTAFENTTAMGALCLARKHGEAALIEAGPGGSIFVTAEARTVWRRQI
jgi:folylpolyglutamate synthase/dihydropteroate synthase